MCEKNTLYIDREVIVGPPMKPDVNWEEKEPSICGVSCLIISGSGKALLSSTLDIIDRRVAEG